MQKELKSFFCHLLNLSVTLKASDRTRNAFRFKDIIPTFMIRKYFTNSNATSAVMFTSAKQNVTFWYATMNIWESQS